MTEIPADIVVTAKRFADFMECRCTDGCGNCDGRLAQTIARAILDERQRCAHAVAKHDIKGREWIPSSL